MNEPPSSSLRRDPFTHEWVSVSSNRQKRPNRPSSDCPFCIGGLEAPERYDAKVFPNRWPSLAAGDPVEVPAGEGDCDGFLDLPARGACDVVLYSPDHDATLGTMPQQDVRRVVDLWADRTTELLARAEVEYVLVFENRGAEAGATIPHPHGQVYSFPFVPPAPRQEADVAERCGCPFCSTVPDEREGPRAVCADGDWAAFVPFASNWPYGVIAAPSSHVPDLASLDGKGRDSLARLLGEVVRAYDALFDGPFPYMFWIHQGLHLHVHFAPPFRSAGVVRYVAAGELGSGMYFNPLAPEQAAEALRAAAGLERTPSEDLQGHAS